MYINNLIKTASLPLLFLAGIAFAGCQYQTGSNISGATSVVSTQAPTASSAPTNVATKAVTIQNFQFSPNALTVKVGEQVTWTNHDSFAHTVTSDTGAFDGNVAAGASYSYTFTKPGTFAYHCSIHPSMTATITVTQ